MKKTSIGSMLFLAFSAALVGCNQLRDHSHDAPPGRVVAISMFKCNCEPIVQESIQDSFIDVFFNYTNAKPVKGENGDITIVGIANIEKGHIELSKGKLIGGGSSGAVAIGGRSSGTSAPGTYISGIVVQAYKNGVLIATHSVGQNLGTGVLVSPISMAQDAAYAISEILVRQNEIAWK